MLHKKLPPLYILLWRLIISMFLCRRRFYSTFASFEKNGGQWILGGGSNFSNLLAPWASGSRSLMLRAEWLTDRRQRVVVDGEVSSWKSVLSGVPQGSVLGPILFLVYIDDLEEGVTGNILKFADDTKLFRKTKVIGDKQKLQDDIDKLVRWSEKWQMLFNFGKCKCLHTGPGNTGMNYEMGGTITYKEKEFDCTPV